MVQAYVVYTLLLVFLLCSSWLYSKTHKTNRTGILITSILICSIIIGLRYNVGVDFLNYEYIYNYQCLDDVEGGYALINKLLFSLGLPSSSIFILVAFFQLFLFTKGVEKINPRYLPLAFFFYFTTLYFFLSLNVLRQTLAFSIFVFSIKFITDHQFIKYVITILITSTIHQSAIILIPLYFILNSDWILRHRVIQIIGYLVTYITAVAFSEYIWSNFEMISTLVGYNDYAEKADIVSEIKWEKEGGLGVYMWMLIDISVILFFSRVFASKIGEHYFALYNLYYIGLLLTNITSGTFLERGNIYFQNIRILIYAIVVYHIFNSRSTVIIKLGAIVILLVLIIFFYMGIHNKASMCAPFMFVSPI